METLFRSDAMALVAPYIDPTTRLDMLDYYMAGQPGKSQDAWFERPIRITALTDSTMQLAAGNATVDFTIIPGGRVAAVTTVPLGAGDSEVRIYRTDGTPLPQAFAMPTYTGWLTDQARKNADRQALLAAIPFITATATVNPATASITLVNTAAHIPGMEPDISSAFRKTITIPLK